ncbi:hypothetical protein CLV33_101582 [Jejuia pallidilutea]|uniref:Uncharacterized protein n=1 Tax=Jejuia pallidilutea TaxID=504487 RepID=A0A362X443_9FLAO|nr:hypothetical protein [Jejuia pallidilutea]PQV51655.1 hypothetical protein CLV33_101582 [Jejuia pallidilutea]
MKTEKLIPVKKVTLKNNCPECFSNNGLQLTFSQMFVETSFYKSITNNISHTIVCNTCNSTIYPERWTDDIERVFTYQQKAFTPKPASKYYKKIFWIVIVATLALFFAALIATALYLEYL